MQFYYIRTTDRLKMTKFMLKTEKRHNKSLKSVVDKMTKSTYNGRKAEKIVLI